MRRASFLVGILAVAAGLIAAPRARASFPIPITVQEVLPAGVPGMARAAGPVTLGIPLEESAGIMGVSQLGLSGASAGQFRELSRWPGGALRWVLVDFQSDLTAGGTNAKVSLTTGAGNFGGPDLASDQGSSIAISTGAGAFRVNKSPFRLFDQVSVGPASLVASGGDGVVVTDVAGVRYTSANDAASSVVLEENGPVRAVIRASGTLRSSSGARLCEYLVRLHFYRGKSYVRAWVSLRNARAEAPTAFTFRSAEVVVPLAPPGGLRFTTATSRGPVSDALAADEAMYLYQAYSAQNGYPENAYPNAPMAITGTTFAQNGVEIRKVNGTIYQPLTGHPDDYASGWAALEDATGRGVTAGLRWMAQSWPAGFELSGDGTVRVELFSKRNLKASIPFAWGAYETRELFFDFHAAFPAARSAALYEMQYPLGGRPPLAQVAAAGGILGETRLVSAAGQARWFLAHGATGPSLANIVPQFWRYHSWSTGGGANQTDFALLDLIDYLRTGNGGFLAEGERNSLFKADTAVRHSDGFDWSANQIVPGDEGSGTNLGAFNGRIFDFEHAHWVSLPIAWYLTGNELYHEAVVDFGEWKHGMGDGDPPNFYRPIEDFGDGGMRGWGRYYRDFALLWDVTRDRRYWDDLDRMTNALLASRDVPGSALPAGRNMERGYLWQSFVGYQLPRSISDFMTVQIHFEAVWEGLRLLREANDPRVEELESYLLGLAEFAYNEMYFDTGPASGQYGYLYAYYLDQKNDAATNRYWAEGFRPISTCRALTFAYQMTGDPKYLARAAKLLIGDIGYVTNRTPTDPASEAFLAVDLSRPRAGWLPVPGASAQDLGGGAYRLTWTVPPGAEGYRIKASERTIVDWLGFDPNTRSFQYPPASHVPWFAASDVQGEPRPLAPGATQSMTLTGFDPSKRWSFSVRYAIDAADPIDPAGPPDPPDPPPAPPGDLTPTSGIPAAP
ncbi:MAG TPA: hypothetical protein VK123_06955 [Candidatus Limnocylindrales bacterium]|nr:hypothetical protein [Candidatus Limnocylindrales bacterium]